MRRARMGAALVATVGAAVVLVACGGSGSSGGASLPSIKFVGNASCPTASASPYNPSPPQVNGDKAVGQAIDEMPHLHVNPPAKVQYDHDPPTSGCHYNLSAPNPAPIQPGVYGQEIAAEYWVHNLEHGYVAILYNCPQGCPTEVQQLIAWRKKLPPDPAGNGQIPYAKVIVLPWHTMKVKFAAVSWDWYEGFDTLDINKIQAFYDNHVGHSPEGAMTG